jgi:hypothetical protein
MFDLNFPFGCFCLFLIDDATEKRIQLETPKKKEPICSDVFRGDLFIT